MPLLTPPNNNLTDLEKEVLRIKADIRRAFAQMQSTFNQAIERIWLNSNPELTPPILLEGFGTEAYELFGLSNAMVQMMNTFAGTNIQTVVPPEWQYAFNPDGSVTITPTEPSSSSSSSGTPVSSSSSSSSSSSTPPASSSSSSSSEAE